ncbi:MAG: amidohydrolase [Nocardioides sp.]
MPVTESAHPEISTLIEETVEKDADTLVDLRRQIHAHPELSWREVRTTELVAERLADAGWRVTRPSPTGLYADLGPAAGGRVALRADLDALPVSDRTGDPWASEVPDVSHACGHDVHTTALLGAALALAEVDRTLGLPGGVRVIFQPAEEAIPGGAIAAIEDGVLTDVTQIFALHCDPSVDTGQVGLRVGAITGAADGLTVRLRGRGGHTSRPHLTEDLVFALGKVITDLPAAAARRFDPRAGVSVVWGRVGAGVAKNVIPHEAELAGTVRMLDADAWAGAEAVIGPLIAEIVAPYGVSAELDYDRGVPPVVNDADAVAGFAAAAAVVVTESGIVPTRQSLGGEDFAWYLRRVPGAMARLGTRTPAGPTYDLHQGNLRIDEGAITIGARLLAEVAIGSLTRLSPDVATNSEVTDS